MPDAIIPASQPPLPPGALQLSAGLPPQAALQDVARDWRPPDYLSVAADQLAKAVASGAAKGPEYVHHRTSESVRIYSNLNGILDDLTPHHDANIKRALASRNPALRAVLNTIIADVVAHFQKPLGEKAIGVKIVQKDRKAPVTPAVAKMQQYITDIVWNGGVVTENDAGEPGVWDSHGDVTADTLPVTVRKLLLDSLVLDQAMITVEGSAKHGGTGRAKQPVMFWRAEDGALARFVDRKRYKPQVRDGRQGRDDITGRAKYVLLAADNTWKVEREFAWDEGAIGIRNPRTDRMAFGYGESEIEQCMMALVGVMYTLQSNQDYFTRNHIPTGILNLIGSYDRVDLQNLRMQLRQDVGYGGGGGLYDFPIIATPPEKGAGATWMNVQDKTRFDLVGRVYIELCVALISAIFQVAPEEYGFAGFGGAQQALQEADPESTIQHSKFRSVIPRVIWLCTFLNKHIVELIAPDFELIIQGLDGLLIGEATAKATLDGLLMQQGFTLNQLRARDDEPPIVAPKDWKLWRDVERQLAGKFYSTDTLRTFAVIEEYERQGGERLSYPDAPTGNPGALQLYMQEMGLNEQQQTQDQMGNIAGGEIQGQQASEQADAAGARDQMGQLAGAADERQAGLQQKADADAEKGVMRVPQAASAGLFGKALEPDAEAAPEPEPRGRLVIRIG